MLQRIVHIASILPRPIPLRAEWGMTTYVPRIEFLGDGNPEPLVRELQAADAGMSKRVVAHLEQAIAASDIDIVKLMNNRHTSWKIKDSAAICGVLERDELLHARWTTAAADHTLAVDLDALFPLLCRYRPAVAVGIAIDRAARRSRNHADDLPPEVAESRDQLKQAADRYRELLPDDDAEKWSPMQIVLGTLGLEGLGSRPR